jgi:hypothetical protein
LTIVSHLRMLFTWKREGRSTHRHVCYACMATKSVKRNLVAKDRGACTRCGINVADEGYKTCSSCREHHASYKLGLRTEVLVRYGAKCSHCGDPRLGCLTFDHVGGWGKDHLGENGRRVSNYSLWKWAKDNGFPDTLRLLCGSCHTNLSFWGHLPTELPTFSRTRSNDDTLTTVAPHTDASTDHLPSAPVTPTTAPGHESPGPALN